MKVGGLLLALEPLLGAGAYFGFGHESVSWYQSQPLGVPLNSETTHCSVVLETDWMMTDL